MLLATSGGHMAVLTDEFDFPYTVQSFLLVFYSIITAVWDRREDGRISALLNAEGLLVGYNIRIFENFFGLLEQRYILLSYS